MASAQTQAKAASQNAILRPPTTAPTRVEASELNTVAPPNTPKVSGSGPADVINDDSTASTSGTLSVDLLSNLRDVTLVKGEKVRTDGL